MSHARRSLLILCLILGSANTLVAAPVEVLVRRLPSGAIQPQAVLDTSGTLHLLYFQGDPGQGDIYYCRSSDLGSTYSSRVRVNSQTGSALAIGTIRGPQMALGRDNRVHVVWMGSKLAQPQAPGGATPLLYARSDAEGSLFESQRNVIIEHVGLDGGGSIAADRQGIVYIVWHAPKSGTRGEQNRRVWITRSTNDGQAFPPEHLAWDGPVGACGCCGIRAYVDGDERLFVMFRAADQVVHRDLYLLGSPDQGATFTARKVSEWNAGQCVMSTSSFCTCGKQSLAAWEEAGQVCFAAIPDNSKQRLRPTMATENPGASENPGQRKNPAVAASGNGTILLAWSERAAWNSTGRVVWQAFDAAGRQLGKPERRRDEVPVWGLVALLACPDGRFVLIY